MNRKKIGENRGIVHIMRETRKKQCVSKLAKSVQKVMHGSKVDYAIAPSCVGINPLVLVALVQVHQCVSVLTLTNM